MAYDLQDFRKDVVEASRTKPIVVDFWASWCGPCKVLGPVLEKLAGEARGRWTLVKIDTEAHPELAAQFGIRSIPAVKMVYQGAIVAEFAGALPEAQVRQWLEKHLPASPEELDVEAHIRELTEAGDRAAVREVVSEMYASEPQSKDLAARLAVLCLPDRFEEARALLSVFTAEPKFEIEKDAILYYEDVRSGAHNTYAGNAAAVGSYVKGREHLADGEYELALEAFIQSMMADRSVDEDGARRGCVTIFTILGEMHPIAKAWRRRFSMALY